MNRSIHDLIIIIIKLINMIRTFTNMYIINNGTSLRCLISNYRKYNLVMVASNMSQNSLIRYEEHCYIGSAYITIMKFTKQIYIPT